MVLKMQRALTNKVEQVIEVEAKLVVKPSQKWLGQKPPSAIKNNKDTNVDKKID